MHPRASVDHFCLPRRCGARRLVGVKDCVLAEEIQLSNYIQKRETPLLVAERNGDFLSTEEDETVEHFKARNMR